MGSVKVNGRTLSSMGIGYTSVSGWSDSPDESRGTADKGGQEGPAEADVESVGARLIRIEGRIRGNTVATRNAVLTRALSHMRGLCEITPGDQPERVVLGRLERTQVSGLRGGEPLVFSRDVVNVRLDFRCVEVLYRDVNAQIVGFTSTPAEVPMGDGPHRGVLTIGGQPTDPAVLVRDFRGNEVARLEFTGTLAADEAWVVDLHAASVVKVDSGVESDAASALTDGAIFRFLPEWAGYSDEAWPTIEITDGSGDLVYWRRWRT